MWKVLSCIVLSCIVLAASAATARAQSCVSQNDVGNAKCIAGALYRCACSQSVGSTLCSWNNAAAACSAVSDDRAAPGAAAFSQKAKRLDRQFSSHY